MKFQLGEHAEDVVTGIQGVITARVNPLGAATRYTIQQTEVKENGEYPNAYDIDEAQLRHVKKGVKVDSVPVAGQHIPLGSEVLDPISKFRGFVVSRIEFLNGCLYYRVEAPFRAEAPTELVTQIFPASRLKVMGVGHSEPASSVAAKHGGPVTRSMAVAR